MRLVSSCLADSQNLWLKVQQWMEAHFLIQPNTVHPFVPLYWGKNSGLITSGVIKCWNLKFWKKKKKKPFHLFFFSIEENELRFEVCLLRLPLQWSRNLKPGRYFAYNLFCRHTAHFWQFSTVPHWFKCKAHNKWFIAQWQLNTTI